MAIRNLSHLISLLTLRGEILFSLGQVKAHPLTQGYVPVFEGLRDDWVVVFAEELALRDGVSTGNARVFSIDATLNGLAGRVSKVLLTITDDDRAHPLYAAYFKKKPLGTFSRPILGAQLEAMRGWIQPLTESDVPALAQLGPEVGAAVALADEAMAARAAMEAAITFFREGGNRKKLFDKVNATRKSTHGELSKMPHENMGLPASFADQFFRHQSSTGEGELTIESVSEEITGIEKQLAEKKELREMLEAEAVRAASDEAEKVAQEALIADLQRIAAEGERKIAEARARIAELSL